jgi:hypothetical protein
VRIGSSRLPPRPSPPPVLGRPRWSVKPPARWTSARRKSRRSERRSAPAAALRVCAHCLAGMSRTLADSAGTGPCQCRRSSQGARTKPARATTRVRRIPMCLLGPDSAHDDPSRLDDLSDWTNPQPRVLASGSHRCWGLRGRALTLTAAAGDEALCLAERDALRGEIASPRASMGPRSRSSLVISSRKPGTRYCAQVTSANAPKRPGRREEAQPPRPSSSSATPLTEPEATRRQLREALA